MKRRRRRRSRAVTSSWMGYWGRAARMGKLDGEKGGRSSIGQSLRARPCGIKGSPLYPSIDTQPVPILFIWRGGFQCKLIIGSKNFAHRRKYRQQ
jgi:hypothetical protein